jgi:hypothetical protein
MTAHGMTTGQVASLSFTTGGATSGSYTVTVLDANNFTVTDSISGSTSGNVTRNNFIRGSFNVSSVTDNSTGDYTVNFTTAMVDANYSISGTTSGNNIQSGSHLSPLDTGVTAGSVRVYDARAGGPFDRPIISVAIFR